MNIMYLKTKELLFQANMAKEGDSNSRVQTDPQTQFLIFACFMVWGNVFKVRKVLRGILCIEKQIRKNIFLNLGKLGIFQVFQPVLPQKSGSPIHLKLLFGT